MIKEYKEEQQQYEQGQQQTRDKGCRYEKRKTKKRRKTLLHQSIQGIEKHKKSNKSTILIGTDIITDQLGDGWHNFIME